MPRTAAMALASVLLAGCTVTTEPAPAPSATAAPEADAADPDTERLESIVTDLAATLAALRAELEAAAAGDAQALQAAAALLVADVTAASVPPTGPSEAAGGPDGDATSGDDPAPDAAPAPDDAGPAEPDDGTAGPDADDTPDDGTAGTDAGPTDGLAPLLPGPLSSREESFQYGDLLTRTLAAARSAGGDGEPVQRFLAVPLAGDLGAWQRAPDDQLAAIATAGTAPDLTSAETAVLALDGEAPRALAWVVHGLAVPADGPASAGRALAHLAVIDLALEQLS